jgi:hypothetical protein
MGVLQNRKRGIGRRIPGDDGPQARSILIAARCDPAPAVCAAFDQPGCMDAKGVTLVKRRKDAMGGTRDRRSRT